MLILKINNVIFTIGLTRTNILIIKEKIKLSMAINFIRKIKLEICREISRRSMDMNIIGHNKDLTIISVQNLDNLVHFEVIKIL